MKVKTGMLFSSDNLVLWIAPHVIESLGLLIFYRKDIDIYENPIRKQQYNDKIRPIVCLMQYANLSSVLVVWKVPRFHL